MWNPFKRKSKQQRQLQKLATSFSIISELSRRGLIHWQVKDKTLLLEENLAILELSRGKDVFFHFLNAVAQWQNFQLLQESYEQKRIETEAFAVREAQKNNRHLTDDDITRIRQHARENMVEIDSETLGVIYEFDIFVLRASAPSADEASEAAGTLLAVGHFDGKTIEMVMYDDVKDILLRRDDYDD